MQADMDNSIRGIFCTSILNHRDIDNCDRLVHERGAAAPQWIIRVDNQGQTTIFRPENSHFYSRPQNLSFPQ